MLNEENIQDKEELSQVENGLNDNKVQNDNLDANELEKLQNELKETQDKFIRLYAEFDNYKRRTLKEKSEYLQTAGKDIITSLLPVLDDIDRAKKAFESNATLESLKEGIDLIFNKFNQILLNKGLVCENHIGEDFNPDFHEAITKIPMQEQSGKIIEEIEKGYKLNGNVIRYAKVIVGE